MNNSNFNIVQLLLVAALVVVSSSLIVACGNLSASRETARRMQNSTQLRGIHQGLVIYSLSNNGRFPGIDINSENDATAIEVQARYALLLDGDYFTPEYAISPSESDPAIVEWDGTSVLTDTNYSFAMLQVPDDHPDLEDNLEGRRTEWGETLNSQAIVVSDRNTGSLSATTSIHTNRQNKGWLGAVLRNDNYVEFEIGDVFETKYGGGELNASDKLFEAIDTFDALMVHTGN